MDFLYPWNRQFSELPILSGLDKITLPYFFGRTILCKSKLEKKKIFLNGDEALFKWRGSLCSFNSTCHGLWASCATEILGGNRKGFLRMKQLLGSETLRLKRCHGTWIGPFTKDQKNLLEGFYNTEKGKVSETDCGNSGTSQIWILTIPFAYVCISLQTCHIFRMAHNYALNFHMLRWIQLLRGKKKKLIEAKICQKTVLKIIFVLKFYQNSLPYRNSAYYRQK